MHADYKDALAAWADRSAARPPEDPEEDKPEEPALQAWHGAPVWCGRCQALIRRQLAELDDLAAILNASFDGHRTTTERDSRVSGSRAARSPSTTADELDELASMLRSWESVYRGEDPKARRGWLATEITTTVSWLVAHFDPMIINPDYAGDLGDEIRTWHHRLSLACKAGTASTPRGLPCPRCRRRSLVQKQGDDYIECTNVDCGRLLSMDDYDALVEEHVRLQEAVRSKKQPSRETPPVIAA